MKTLIVGIVIGLVFGFWLGVNIGRDRPLLSNPFVESTMSETLKEKTGEAVEKAGQGMEKIGEGIRDKLKE